LCVSKENAKHKKIIDWNPTNPKNHDFCAWIQNQLATKKPCKRHIKQEHESCVPKENENTINIWLKFEG
jgi:hypothetical protein